jgi:hypothetical protein
MKDKFMTATITRDFKLKSSNSLYYDKCKINFGYKFEHLLLDCPDLVEHPKGNWIPLGLCFSLWTKIELRIPELAMGASYTIIDLCGTDYWSRLSDVLRYVAHDCVMFLIEEEEIQLPLIAVTQNADGLPLYQLK